MCAVAWDIVQSGHARHGDVMSRCLRSQMAFWKFGVDSFSSLLAGIARCIHDLIQSRLHKKMLSAVLCFSAFFIFGLFGLESGPASKSSNLPGRELR